MRKADEKKQELRKAVRIRRHMPVRAWIAEWMTTYKEPNVSEKTYQDYKYIMAHVDIDMPLAEVKPIHLQRILNDQAGKSTSFLRKLNLLMRECFEAAVDNELIPANPARKLTLPKGYTGKRRALTAEEKKLVLKVAKTHRAGTWVLLMLLCGMRPSEAAKIQGRDVDFQSMRIHVRGTKTASADRFVPLPARLKDSLSGLEPFEYAVKDTRGNPTTPTSRRTMWASFMKAVQIAAGARTEREKHASVPHLPIKFFEKRKVDEQLTEAGGSKTPPKWVLEGDALTQHAQQLSGSMAKVSASFEAYKQEEHELPMVMTTIITEDALAKTHRKAVVDLLNSDNNANVIGIEPDRTEKESSFPESAPETNSDENHSETKETRRLMSIVASDQLISNINRALQDTQGSAKLISSIADMQPFEAMRGAYNFQGILSLEAVFC